MTQTLEDATKSLRFYVMKHLRAEIPTIDVRLAIEEDAWQRPSAIVQTAGAAQLSNTSRRISMYIRPFAIYVYPEKANTAREAELAAQRVESIIQRAFRKGGFQGHPARIPMWDWTEIDEGESLESVLIPAPDPEPIDYEPQYRAPDPIAYMRVNDSNVDHRSDPQDEKLQTIITNIRLEWRDLAEVDAVGSLVDGSTLQNEVT